MLKNTKAGYTLPEVMIAISIFVMLMGMALSFFIDSQKLGHRSELRNQINRDFRVFTQLMATDAHNANFFVIYERLDRASAREHRLEEMKSGDFLIFVSLYEISEDPTVQPHQSGSDTVKRIVGYFRDPDNQSFSPINRFELSLPHGSKAVDLESYLPSNPSYINFKEVVDTSEGLSDGALFYNFRGRSVLVNGRFYRGRNDQPITETYKFTVSPRG